MHILAINPGSTSTKISVYDDREKLFETTIRHSSDEIKKFNKVVDQYKWREGLVISELEKVNIRLSDLKAIVARGGLLKPIEGGTYAINDEMLKDLKKPKLGEHASNLGAFIAKAIADTLNIPSFIVDPVVVDELDEVSRISGFNLIERKSIFHALNQKAVARVYASGINKKYEDLNLIVVHMGGGISVGAHKKGRVVDVNNALDGEGPFSPERSGALPASDIVAMCYSGKYTISEMMQNLIGHGGIVSYLETNDMLDVCNRAESGDKKCGILIDAMCYQTSKEVGAMATALNGNVDAILITGGMARDERILKLIRPRISFISEVFVYPGEEEMRALTDGCLRALEQPSSVKKY